MRVNPLNKKISLSMRNKRHRMMINSQRKHLISSKMSQMRKIFPPNKRRKRKEKIFRVLEIQRCETSQKTNKAVIQGTKMTPAPLRDRRVVMKMRNRRSLKGHFAELSREVAGSFRDNSSKLQSLIIASLTMPVRQTELCRESN
jgi:hypothetical protein